MQTLKSGRELAIKIAMRSNMSLSADQRFPWKQAPQHLQKNMQSAEVTGGERAIESYSEVKSDLFVCRSIFASSNMSIINRIEATSQKYLPLKC